MWTSFLIQHGWPYDVLSLFHLYFVAATCCRKCTHGAITLLSLILSPRLVRLIAATKFCRSDNDFHKINRVTQGDGIVAATCPRDVSQRRSDLSASVSRLPRPLQISSLTAHGFFFLITSLRDRWIVINNLTARKTWAKWTYKKKTAKYSNTDITISYFKRKEIKIYSCNNDGW